MFVILFNELSKMKTLYILHIYFLLSAVILQVKSLNILTVFSYQGRSHFITLKPYVEELAKRGHNVTVISYFPREKPLENYHDITLEGIILPDDSKVERNYKTIFDTIHFVINSGVENCEVLLQNKEVQRLWKTKVKYDVVVVEQFNTDCGLGLSYKLEAPVVGITTHSLMPWQYSRYGIPSNPSYVQFHFLEGGTKPSFFQRIERLFFFSYSYIYHTLAQWQTQDILSRYFDVPPLEELARNIKVLLLYSNNVLFGSSLLPANVIEVQGYHITTESKPLPQDLKKFIDEAEHGVIYISFGSVIRASTISSDMLKIISTVLSELPQKVVWKWENTSSPGNLQNVYYAKWLPQKDILAHPNVVAFYSHCGLGGTTEAVHFGVPILGMPVLGDQPSNAAAIEHNGFGVQISLSELSEEVLLEKFKTVLDPEFRDRVKYNSKIWRDRPLSALDSAVFWTEYVARHRNFQFRSPAADVPFYQYMFLDVAILFLLICVIMYSVIRYLCSLVIPAKTTNTKVKAKKSNKKSN